MNRFYVEKEHIDKDSIRVVDADDVHHLLKVLRIRHGEELFVSDGCGQGYVAVFERDDKNTAFFSIKEKLPLQKREDRPILLTLACAIPKVAKFEEVVDKGVQLGVDAIVPLLTERTRKDEEDYLKKIVRLDRIRRTAAKQSGALFLPELHRPVTFDGFISQLSKFDLCLLPNLSVKTKLIKDVLADFKGRRLAVMIGPEGDFSPREVEAALRAGCVDVSLGESVLRVDTAAIAVMSFIRFSN
jgi:16S rRNA (uracil1498-N3)-methyltransferase